MGGYHRKEVVVAAPHHHVGKLGKAKDSPSIEDWTLSITVAVSCISGVIGKKIVSISQNSFNYKVHHV